MKKAKFIIFSSICFISVILFCITFFFRWYLFATTFYSSPENSIEAYFASPIFLQLQSQDANKLYNAYLEEQKKTDFSAAELEKSLQSEYENTNFLFILTNAEKSETLSNTNLTQLPRQAIYSFEVTGTNQIISIECGIMDPPTYPDKYADGLSKYQFLVHHKDAWSILYKTFFFIGIISFGVFTILLYREKKKNPTINTKWKKIPIEITILLLIAIIDGIFWAGKLIIKPMKTFQPIFATLVFCSLLLIIFAFVVIQIIVAQIATKTIKKYSLCSKIATKIEPYFLNWKYKKKVLLLLLVVVSVNIIGYFLSAVYNIYSIIFYLNGGLKAFIYTLLYQPWNLILGQIPLLVTVAFGVWLYKIAGQQQKLVDEFRKVAISPLESTLETNDFSGITKEIGEEMQNMQVTLQTALTQQMKSEKTKTQLISNVSHDIKTPLTSIVNYTELLRRNNGQQPMQEEYLAVLTRQSMRLKKMCEDIVDASRFSSHDIQVENSNINLHEFVEQMVAEYQYRFMQQNISAIISVPHDINIFADGDLLWRIFDNLLSNVAKYSQPDTRFYLQAKLINIAEDKQVKIDFLNISKQELNMPVEELLQRFVQGDISRYTEGSGLGLSIVQDLATLQNGTFSIKIEGDLFSATLLFPKTP